MQQSNARVVADETHRRTLIDIRISKSYGMYSYEQSANDRELRSRRT